MDWWQPVNVFIRTVPAAVRKDFADVDSSACCMVNMDQYLNDSVTSIFHEQYFSPRSPYTTLQLPIQGIGEWCHPLLSATIDDSGLRSLIRDNRFNTSLGVPFRLMKRETILLLHRYGTIIPTAFAYRWQERLRMHTCCLPEVRIICSVILRTAY